MRVNKTLPAHQHAIRASDVSTNQMKRLYGAREKGNYAAPRTPDTVPPNTYTNPNRTPYRTGDGDYFTAPQRPGSDHSSIGSRGYV